jgi:hypothetical protein
MLLENGLFYENDGSPIVITFIKWIDGGKDVGYSWWLESDFVTGKNGMKTIEKSFESYLKSALQKNYFYLIRPGLFFYQSLSDKTTTSDLMSVSEMQSFAQRIGAQILIKGQVLMKDRLLQFDFEGLQVQNLRPIAQVSRKFPFEKNKEGFEIVSQEISSQMLEAWQKGSLGASVYRLNFLGRVPPLMRENIKEFLKPGGDLKSITAITAKGGTLLVLDKTGKQVATIGTDGKVKKTYDIKEGDSYISSDDKFIYTMGDAVTSIDRGNGDVKQLFKDTKGTSFDIFGSNIYALSGSDILKYKAPAYEEASYFTDKPSFKSTPTDISISGPIWVLEANGGIERFTKGKNDDIELSGLTGAIASGAKIYADPDNTNVYVMDVKNQRVVVLNDKGEYQTQYEGSFIKDGISFAIDEKNKVGYVLSGNLIYSFDL